MMTKSNFVISALLTVLLCAWGANAAADKGDWGKDKRFKPPPPSKDMVLDRRHDHNRYYPPRGKQFDRLPHNHYVVPYRDRRYFYHGGIWYCPSGPRYVVVMPPVGVTIPILPPFHTTIWVGGVPYYYADGVYYQWRPAERVYVVSEPPQESSVATMPAEPEELFIYPKQGQSEAQVAADRYECHRWAREQSGFDPTQPPANISESQLAAKRSDYRRAITACLEARGYSVK